MSSSFNEQKKPTKKQAMKNKVDNKFITLGV